MATKDAAEHICTLDEILKACAHIDDAAKLKIFAARYDELHKLYRNLEFRYTTSKREISGLNAEKNKQVLARSRLEGLCRELQKQNKVIKDESLLKIREEEEKRKHITQEFQKTLSNVTSMMCESNTQNNKLGEENKQMAERLSSIYEEFKTRENEVDRISKQIDIERQLSEARCAKMKTEFMIEKQTLISEKDELNEKIARLTRELLDATGKCILLEHQVVDLTAQVDKYTGKYEEFENTISKSGKVFDHCKAEICKMNKQINTLEKEIVEWQNRYHKNISTIYELQLESTEKTKVIEYITKKQNQLTKLCRQLQAERKAYITALRNLGQDPSTIPIEVVDDDPSLDEASNSKPGQVSNPTGEAPEKATDSNLKNKPLKAKRGKQKGKKGKDASECTPPMTLKEIQLAELKEELHKVQSQVLQIQAQQAAAEEQPAGAVIRDVVGKVPKNEKISGKIESDHNKTDESIDAQCPVTIKAEDTERIVTQVMDNIISEVTADVFANVVNPSIMKKSVAVGAEQEVAKDVDKEDSKVIKIVAIPLKKEKNVDQTVSEIFDKAAAGDIEIAYPSETEENVLTEIDLIVSEKAAAGDMKMVANPLKTEENVLTVIDLAVPDTEIDKVSEIPEIAATGDADKVVSKDTETVMFEGNCPESEAPEQKDDSCVNTDENM